jgi:hypothetical protein
MRSNAGSYVIVQDNWVKAKANPGTLFWLTVELNNAYLRLLFWNAMMGEIKENMFPLELLPFIYLSFYKDSPRKIVDFCFPDLPDK